MRRKELLSLSMALLFLIFSIAALAAPQDYFETEINDNVNSPGTQKVVDPQALLHGASNQDSDVWLLDDIVFTDIIYVKKVSGNAEVRIYESDTPDFLNARSHSVISSTFKDVILDETKYYYLLISNGNPSGHQIQIGNEPLVPLPVELYKFESTVLGKDIVLEWTTLSELNNEYFEIEYSSDGEKFKTIGKIAGHGTTEEINYYVFVFENAENENNYFRLKQVDFGGKFEYSKIIYEKIEIDRRTPIVKIFPNPVLSNDVSIVSNHNGEFKMFNAGGTLMNANLKASMVNEIDVSNLEGGVYYISFRNEKGISISKQLIILK